MKILISFLALVLMTKDCDQQKSQNIPNESNTVEVSKTENQAQENMMFTYEKMTRGFYEIIWITKDSISFSNNQSDLSDKKTYNLPQEDWNKLLSLLQDFNIKTLPELEAPSKMHQYDGAAMATLKINTKEEVYKTNIFDHGYPPKAIEALVNKVLSMKKMIQKQ
jgi:hypothetical protein